MDYQPSITTKENGERIFTIAPISEKRHGGPGRGQGRHTKPGGPMPNRTIRMTDEEYIKVKQFLKDLRTSQK
jgi:hypothetical protein